MAHANGFRRGRMHGPVRESVHGMLAPDMWLEATMCGPTPLDPTNLLSGNWRDH
jgi:hypothetical protein